MREISRRKTHDSGGIQRLRRFSQCVPNHTEIRKWTTTPEILDYRPSVVRQSALRSMDADGLELLAPGVGDRRLTAVGQHDRRAVGRVQGEQLHAGVELRRL